MQRSESMPLGILLTGTGGFLDAYTYIYRGGVFANAQTGNLVMLGLNIAQGHWISTIRYLIPIAAFLAGTMLALWIRIQFQNGRFHWRQAVVLLEALILATVILIPKGEADMAANVLVSFVCAMQVSAFRKIHGHVLATTMCTGNLRSGTELLMKYWETKDRNVLKAGLKYFGIVLCFVVGAGVGTAVTLLSGTAAPLFCIGCLVICFFLMNGRE